MKRMMLICSLLMAVSPALYAQSEVPTELKDTVADTAPTDIIVEGSAGVKARKPTVRVKPDKVTYDLTADNDTKGQNLLDMLRKVPLVTVDGQDNITVNGSSNFKIYVNGKPAPLFNQNASLILKSMPASYAKHIEVITHPGAKYDAEGVGGILNIVTNDAVGGAQAAANGYSFNAGARISNRMEEGNAFYSLQRGKFSLSTSLMANHQHLQGIAMNSVRQQFMGQDTLRTHYTLHDVHQQQHYYQGNISVSYQIDSLRLLTASASVMRFSSRQPNVLDFETTQGETSLQSYRMDQHARNHYVSINGGIDYQRGFRNHKDRLLTLSYQVSTSPSRNRTNTLFTDISGNLYDATDRLTDARTRSTEHTAQADFTTPIAQGHTFSTGAKYIGRQNSSDAKYYDAAGFNAANSMDYHHYNDIGAVYAEYEGKQQMVNWKTGLRYEHTWQRVRYADHAERNFSLHYANLVPSATVGWTMSATQSLSMSYQMRISRPSIDYLNPYVDRSNLTAISYGNSDLDCEKTHAVDLRYNVFSGAVFASLNLRYSYLGNAIENYSFYDGYVMNSTFGNVARNQQTTLDTYVRFQPRPTTTLSLNGNLSYVDLHSHALNQSSHGVQGRAFLGCQQTLPANLKLSANLFWNSRNYKLQGYEDGLLAVMGSLTKSFLKNERLTAGIFGFTPLSGVRLHINTHMHGHDYAENSRIKVPIGQIGVLVSYQLGRTGVTTKKVRRSIENDDLKQGSQSQKAASGGSIGGLQ